MRKLALLSDIHGNLEALEAVLRDVDRQRPDMLVVLGDTINYGPNPRECMELVERHADVVLAGNHEKEAAAPGDDQLAGDAREMLDWTVTQLSGFPLWEKLRAQILAEGEARSRATWRELTFVHGSAKQPADQYVWPGHPAHHLQLNKQLDQWLVSLLKPFKTRHSFCGHTHVPALLTSYEDREIFPIDRDWNRGYTFVGPHAIFYVPEDNVTLEGIHKRKMVINPGSVGQPRDQNPHARLPGEECVGDAGGEREGGYPGIFGVESVGCVREGACRDASWKAAHPIEGQIEGVRTEDTWVATLTFPTGVANAFLTWKAGVRKGLFTIHGERGAVVVDDDEIQIVAPEAPNDAPKSGLRPRPGRISVPSDCQDARHSAWFGPIWPRFRNAVASDRFVGKDALDALRTIQVIEAAYQSAANAGQQCALDLTQPLAAQRPRMAASVTA